MLKPIYFEVNGQKIKGTLVFPPKLKKKNPGVLFLHGWGSREKGYIPRAKAVAEKGAVCLTFNMRGHGTSEGDLDNLSRGDHLKDAVAAYDFLASQERVDKERIGVVGASYGGSIASILTSRRTVRWLVLRAPALYPNEESISRGKLTEDEVKEYGKRRLTPQDNAALRSLSEFIGEVLLVESEKEEVLPPQTSKNYLAAVNLKASFSRRIIKSADHSLTDEKSKKEFIKILSEWFGERL